MKLKTIFSMPVLVAVVLSFSLFMASCSKTTNSPSFPGTYIGTIGTSAGSGNNDTITITAGANSSSIVMLSETSSGAVYTIGGTVSGSNLTLNTGPFFYNGSVDTVSGTGSLNNSSLTINYHFTGNGVTNNYIFTGTKH